MKLKYILYIAVILLLNVAGTTLFFRIDLTENKSYSLSEASKELVRTLEEPLTIKVFLSQNLPVPYNTLERDIRDILLEYKLKANKHFNFTIDIINKDEPGDVDPSTYNIFPINIQNIEQDEMKVVSAYIGMAFIHGDIVDTIPAIEYNQNLELTITEKIRILTEKTTALLSLKENIKATLYLSPVLYSLSDDLKSYPGKVENKIKDLNNDYFNRLDFEFIETDKAVDSSMKTLNIEDGQGNVSHAVAALLIENGEETYPINIINRDIFGRTVISDPEKLDEEIRSIIDKMIGAQTKIGYLTSNGTIPMTPTQQDPTINTLSSIIYNSYTMSAVDLSKGEINSDIKTLIIARPTYRFSEREIFILDQFLLKGNSILLAIDQIDMDTEKSNPNYGQEVYKFVDHGLTELLSSYGIELGDSIVMDENSFKQVQKDRSGSLIESQIYFAPLIQPNNVNKDLPFMIGVNDLITFRMSEVRKSKPDDDSVITLFSSSESSWTQPIENLTLNPGRITPPLEKSSYPLAQIKTGNFTSFFKDKSIPAKEISQNSNDSDINELPGVEESESIVKQSKNGKLLVLGSSDMVTDSILSQNYPSNVLFMQNIIDYLSGREDYTLMRSKGVFNRPMKETTSLGRNIIKYFNIIGLPILVALTGLIIYLLWLKRKKEIMGMFMEVKDEK